jgi:1-aminocyclopropane-1-carboxylate deaminase
LKVDSLLPPSDGSLLPEDWIHRELSFISTLAPIQSLSVEALARKNIRLSIKREDLLHPRLGGNKIYKLYGHLRKALIRPDLPIASFGGAYSNHIYALAAAGKSLNLTTIGIIRGERPAQLSATLQDAVEQGMNLIFVSRQDYRLKDTYAFRQTISAPWGDCHWIPEGGAGREGIEGCVELARGIIASVDSKPDIVCHACGTGFTVAGLVIGLALSPVEKINVLGVSVLKGYKQLTLDIASQIQRFGFQSRQWRVDDNYHCGGYAKYPEYLASFVRSFEEETSVPLDPVYTAKMMWGIVNLAEQGVFPEGARILAIHSGGLQGKRGVE